MVIEKAPSTGFPRKDCWSCSLLLLEAVVERAKSRCLERSQPTQRDCNTGPANRPQFLDPWMISKPRCSRRWITKSSWPDLSAVRGTLSSISANMTSKAWRVSGSVSRPKLFEISPSSVERIWIAVVPQCGSNCYSRMSPELSMSRRWFRADQKSTIQ